MASSALRYGGDTGAKVLAGGTYKDLFFQATVLGDVTSDMPVFTEEIFGPVAPITVFENEDHAVELANSSEYGLAAAIHNTFLIAGEESSDFSSYTYAIVLSIFTTKSDTWCFSGGPMSFRKEKRISW
ncbi:aldehyde dehydrogenase family protein [uncultured Herbaspirillum sp.]|uniref:aldehyde dehydrogenase family protein n=1 Tax=uncultured Herbaspirillum sp. TaxID=160236 RepID=UPI00261BD0C2|nr:aldehyde dehydrogenase family protein [uncultured Herbaspirillum sp.]